MLCNFSVRMIKYFLKKFNFFFCPQKVEKTTPKSCLLMAVGRVFFSSAQTAQNSPELHFRFINSFFHPSLLKSLLRSALDLKKNTSFSPWLQQFTRDLLAANVSPWFGCKKLSRAKIFSSSFFIVMISPPVKVDF